MTIIQPSAREVFRVANSDFLDLENLIFLSGYITGAGNIYCTPRQNFAGSGYVVPAGKSLYLRAMKVITDGAVAVGNGINIGYADTDAGVAGAVAPTNRVTPAGNQAYAFNTTKTYEEVPIWIVVPTGKYPVVAGTAGAGVNLFFQLFGYAK